MSNLTQEKFDIVLMLDTNHRSAVPHSQWIKHMQEFASNVAAEIQGAHFVRFGVLGFSDKSEIALHLDAYQNPESINAGIAKLGKSGGGSNLAEAMKQVRWGSSIWRLIKTNAQFHEVYKI